MDNMTTETDSSKLVTSLFEPVTNMDNMTTVLYYGAQLALVLGVVTLIDAVLRPCFAYSSPLLVEWDSENGLYPAFRRQRHRAWRPKRLGHEHWVRLSGGVLDYLNLAALLCRVHELSRIENHPPIRAWKAARSQ
ncbi:uncharacterized protein PG998_011562 [Apiospora kogelbergensis]|uniref:uncharacterized protein n=1 Tax=Apiospora kogelbergensis TaxID=1337665 RepID=UPI0031315807